MSLMLLVLCLEMALRDLMLSALSLYYRLHITAGIRLCIKCGFVKGAFIIITSQSVVHSAGNDELRYLDAKYQA